MTMVQLGVLLSAGVFFLAALSGLIVPFFTKRTDEYTLLPLSWGVGLLFIVTLVSVQLCGSVFGLAVVPLDFQLIILLSGVGLLLMPLLVRYSFKLKCLTLLLLCGVGTLVLPFELFGIGSIWGVVGIRIIIALCWALFILVCGELDRVPIEGFVLNMGFFLLFLVMSMGLFGILPQSVFNLCMQILTLLLVLLLIFKRNTFIWLGFPMVFVLTYIAGYIFTRLAVSPNGAFVLIMLLYPITETIRTIVMNVYHYKRFFPITYPFITEQAFARGLPVTSVLQKVFYVMLITGLVGTFGLRSSLEYWPVSMLMGLLVVYGMYIYMIRMASKVSLKSVKNDVKMGCTTLWKEITKVPLKQKTQAKDTTENQTVCMVDEPIQEPTKSMSVADKTKKKTVKRKKTTRSIPARRKR